MGISNAKFRHYKCCLAQKQVFANVPTRWRTEVCSPPRMPQIGGKPVFLIALIRTASCRIPASPSTNQGDKKGGLIVPIRWRAAGYHLRRMPMAVNGSKDGLPVTRSRPVARPILERTRPEFCTDDRLRGGCHESRRCSRDIYPESYITKYTSIRRKLIWNRDCGAGCNVSTRCRTRVQGERVQGSALRIQVSGHRIP